MKKKVASRKLKRRCVYCNGSFSKGSVYYLTRKVSTLIELHAYEFLTCAKCKYKEDQRELRFEKFRETCPHKPEFVHMMYSSMWGESIDEPSHEECFLCYRVVR